MDITTSYNSFGRYPKLKSSDVKFFEWRHKDPNFSEINGKILPRGYGKSYGDSCLFEDQTLLDITSLNHLLEFDESSGILKAEAGLRFDKALRFLIPNKYFLPVTPGTKFISLAGAIANDVHGKNHHAAGTFGRHVNKFELLRSNGERLICSPSENSELFKATIGGLGLTGIITWAEFKNTPSPSPYFYVENIKYKNLDEFFEINDESVDEFPYTVSWVDCTSSGSSLGRGIYNRGRMADPNTDIIPEKEPDDGMKQFPFDAPFINSFTTKAFNTMWYNKQVSKFTKGISHYNPFFYPLDGVDDWNKAYGKNGFVQYQYVVPHKNGKEITRKILKSIQKSGLSSFLVVLKTFGDLESPGMLSFPEPGITLAVDFRMEGQKTLDLCDELDKYVVEVGGKLYPAKDARMSAENFQKFYPNWKEFSEFIDPKISSSFWERVSKS